VGPLSCRRDEHISIPEPRLWIPMLITGSDDRAKVLQKHISADAFAVRCGRCVDEIIGPLAFIVDLRMLMFLDPGMVVRILEHRQYGFRKERQNMVG
jgi:hypothetical protein